MDAFRSRVYTDRPAYADLDSPEKFQAISGIIMTRLRQHPKAICSYSGGADSDIMIDLIERCRKVVPSLPKVDYVFFNTGLEMKATKDHVKFVEQKYGITIRSERPKVNIVQASRKYGIPFVSKIMSGGLSEWQKYFDRKRYIVIFKGLKIIAEETAYLGSEYNPQTRRLEEMPKTIVQYYVIPEGKKKLPMYSYRESMSRAADMIREADKEGGE